MIEVITEYLALIMYIGLTLLILSMGLGSVLALYLAIDAVLFMGKEKKK